MVFERSLNLSGTTRRPHSLFREGETRIRSVVQTLADRKVFRRSAGGVSQSLISYFRGALIENAPLRFSAFWGVGRKGQVDDPEKFAVQFMQDWMARVASLLELEWHCDFLLTDTHALANGIAQDLIDRYCLSAIDTLQGPHCGFQRLTAFLTKEGLANVLDLASSWDQDGLLWESLPEAIKSELSRLAGIHACDREPHMAAMLYVKLNTIESAILSRSLVGRAFVTYLPPSFAFLLPSLPLIHTYVGPDHLVRRPWFDGSAYA